jgi:hypothetical protein
MVAVESSFASIDATDARALDDTTIAGLTAYPMRITRSSYSAAVGAAKMGAYDAQEISARGGIPPAIVEAAVNASGPVKSLKGDITLEFEARGFGTNAPASTGLGAILSSGLARVLRTPGDSFTATYVSANTFTNPSPASDALAVVGDIIAVQQTNGTFRFCKVTDVVDGGATNTVTTLEPHGIPAASTATVRCCHMFYGPVDGTPDGASVAIQLAERDASQVRLVVGARLSKLSIKKTGTSALSFSCTLTAPDGEYRSAAVIPTNDPLPLGVTATTPLRTLVAPLRVTQNHASSSAPFAGTASDFPVTDWSVDIVNSMTNQNDQGTRSGITGMDVSTSVLTGSFTQDARSGYVDFREVLRLSEKRSVGFTAAGANAAGNGFCVWVGAAETPSDPGLNTEDMKRTQAVEFRAGDYQGDDDSGSPAEYVNAPWILAFVA